MVEVYKRLKHNIPSTLQCQHAVGGEGCVTKIELTMEPLPQGNILQEQGDPDNPQGRKNSGSELLSQPLG